MNKYIKLNYIWLIYFEFFVNVLEFKNKLILEPAVMCNNNNNNTHTCDSQAQTSFFFKKISL